jgi:hypothetical protein
MHALKTLIGFSGYFGRQTGQCCQSGSCSNNVAKILQFMGILQHLTEKR